MYGDPFQGLQQISPPLYLYLCSQARNYQFVLFKSSCPPSWLQGQNSPNLKPSDEPRIRRLFPNAEFVWLEETGPWLHLEKSKEFLQHVVKFLERKEWTSLCSGGTVTNPRLWFTGHFENYTIINRPLAIFKLDPQITGFFFFVVQDTSFRTIICTLG